MMTEVGAVLERVDLGALVEADLGPARKRSGRYLFWVCPFHGERTPSLAVTVDNGRWHCFGCGAGGDAIDWVRQRRGLDFRGAVRALGGMELPERAVQVRRGPEREDDGPPGSLWQEAARVFVNRTVRSLWGAEGARARGWLGERGLAEETLREWRVGFHAQEEFAPLSEWGFAAEEKRRRVWLPRGVTLPCVETDEGGAERIWRIKVRVAAGAHKYPQVRGSRKALYGAGRMAARRVVMVCEGEFDALLVWQEARELVDVVTLGGAGQVLPARWLGYLLGAERILVAYDNDRAGEVGAAGWVERFPGRARRVCAPQGRDVTEFWQAGGDVRGWVEWEVGRALSEKFGKEGNQR